MPGALSAVAVHADRLRGYLRSFLKAHQSSSNRSSDHARELGQCSSVAGVLGPHAGIACSAAGHIHACSVPWFARHFGIGAQVRLHLEDSHFQNTLIDRKTENEDIPKWDATGLPPPGDR